MTWNCRNMYEYKLYIAVIYTFIILTVHLLVIIKNNKRCTVRILKKSTKYHYITIKHYDKSTTELIRTSEVPWHWCVYSKSNRPYLHSPVPPFCRSSRNWSYAALRSPVTDANANSAKSWIVHEDSSAQTINCQSVWSMDLISLGQITLFMQHFELWKLWGEYHGATQL